MSTGALDTAPVPGLASIIIVNWNGGAMLLDCLRSVRAQVYAPVEILLVDNGSTDGSADRAAERTLRAIESAPEPSPCCR